jgi:cytochrome c peroxidase
LKTSIFNADGANHEISPIFRHAAAAIHGYSSPCRCRHSKRADSAIPKAVVKNPAMVELGKKLFLNRACQSPVLFLVIPATTCPLAAVTISARRLATIGSKGLSVPFGAQFQHECGAVLGWPRQVLAGAGQRPDCQPQEMASNHVLALDVLRSIPAYVNEFDRCWPSKSPCRR